MKSFDTVRRVAHSADDMFALVADVERYPEFVPLCAGMRVSRRRKIAGGEEMLCAMTVAYKAFHETFTTRTTLLPERSEILVQYIDGPFRDLKNRWSFEPLGPKACKVRFFIAYQFHSRTLQLVAGAVFDRAFRKFVDAFEARADRLYGKRKRLEEVKS
ncbi:MAG: type II toxin-antitoxin system RatA family toxin [Hyphomicrobiales bacterium]|nr:type II toxin-antitoxin system RatA family toxin [Hyphomicrobiales bacterium]